MEYLIFCYMYFFDKILFIYLGERFKKFFFKILIYLINFLFFLMVFLFLRDFVNFLILFILSVKYIFLIYNILFLYFFFLLFYKIKVFI